MKIEDRKPAKHLLKYKLITTITPMSDWGYNNKSDANARFIVVKISFDYINMQRGGMPSFVRSPFCEH